LGEFTFKISISVNQINRPKSIMRFAIISGIFFTDDTLRFDLLSSCDKMDYAITRICLRYTFCSRL